MAMRLSDEQVEWLAERVPDAPVNPRGGRPPMDKRQALRGIFWVLDNGAKWKDLPRQFGAKSAVHKYFTTWVKAGVFEGMMRDAGRLVEERDGYRLYECFIDGTFEDITETNLIYLPASPWLESVAHMPVTPPWAYRPGR